jgi:hypothetical protein
MAVSYSVAAQWPLFWTAPLVFGAAAPQKWLTDQRLTNVAASLGQSYPNYLHSSSSYLAICNCCGYDCGFGRRVLGLGFRVLGCLCHQSMPAVTTRRLLGFCFGCADLVARHRHLVDDFYLFLSLEPVHEPSVYFGFWDQANAFSSNPSLQGIDHG